ncbi:MAG: FeoA family protein [Oscillospiraceae bacterium]
MYTSLDQLSAGDRCRVKKLKSDGTIRRRMLDLGLVNDTLVEALQKSPSGDPTAYFIRGAVIAIRSDEASNIIVECV